MQASTVAQLQHAVELLKAKKLHIATAESCTGGMLAAMITDVAGASSVFECGIVCYSNSIKAHVLGVNEELLKTKGAVCEEVAFQLADNVNRLAKADIGIGITGMAGPTSDEEGKPVGLIYITLTDGEHTLNRTLLTEDNRDGCRNRNRLAAVRTAVELIEQYCNQEGEDA